jgi:hypothetical protein
LSMYQACVPPTVRTLRALSTILSKAQAHCEAKSVDPQALLQSRIFPDMFPLTRQVQIACDMVKGGAARLGGVEIPSFPDTETTWVLPNFHFHVTTAYNLLRHGGVEIGKRDFLGA